MLGLVIVVLTALSLADAGDVLTLTDADFDSRLAGFDMTLVKFYAPWCGHCKKLAPEFERAATVLKDNDPPVILAEVDCTADGKDMCSRHGVSGYPTLKAFKRGEKAFDYEGPRDADGIVKYMKGKAGPSSKELQTVADAEKFLSNSGHSIVGFFEDAASHASNEFQKLATAFSDDYRFAHSSNADVLDKYGYKETAVIFRPSRLQTKLEPDRVEFTGDFALNKLKDWVSSNVHGLAGHRTTSNTEQFKNPLVVVYYDVDYNKNPKGTNYWRNRVIKVAKKFADSGRKVSFAISDVEDFQHEVSAYGLSAGGDKPVVAARDEKDQKFVMEKDFSPDELESFVTRLLDGQLKPYLKSEPVPTSNDDPVKVVVASTFDEIVNDPTKDVLIEFYAPWCGHCKSLAPKYEELATKLASEDDVVIAKMDATANDVPSAYNVRGFPTLYFAPKNSKSNPKSYDGGREVDDFIKYLARESTEPLSGYTREGKKVKSKKTEL